MDQYKSSFREKRLTKYIVPTMKRIFDKNGKVDVLDVGGKDSYWLSVKDDLRRLNVRVTLANLSYEKADGGMPPNEHLGDFTTIIADVRKLSDYNLGKFDFVHSNSVIEHVGGWLDMKAAALEIRKAADSYYVQVPNFWFPVEPHFRTALFHWLPEQVRARLITRFALGVYPRAKSYDQAVEWVQRSQLLDRSQMKALFPDGEIIPERLLGLPKSYIAIKNSVS